MKKLLATCFVLFVIFNTASAQCIYYSEKELISQSNLIVIGTLNSVKEYKKDNYQHGEGNILIEKVIAGEAKSITNTKVKSNDVLKLKWQYALFVACRCTQHQDSENKKLIWFLNIEKDGSVSAFTSGSSVGLENLTKIKKLLGKKTLLNTNERLKLVEQTSIRTKTKKDFNETNKNNTDKKDEFRDLRTFLTVIISIFAYFIFYRSRFKIR